MARGTTANGYYVDQENGKMVTGVGWQHKDNKYFYLNSDDSVGTGWIKDKNIWYYFYPENPDAHYQGEMAEDTIINGWKVDSSGKWITNDDTNIGWKQIGDDWYYFNDSGKIVTNTWIQGSDGNSWYYVDSDGKMKTTDYKEYDNGRRIYFHQDGTAFEFDYDGGDGEYTDDVDNAISLIPGGRAGVIFKNVGKNAVKTIVKEAEKKVARETERKVAQEIEKKTAEKVIEGGSKAADYKFPKSNNDMKKIFGVNDKTFHKEIKTEIIKQINKDPVYSKEFKKMGNNPDSGVDGSGNIVLKDVRTGKTLQTNWSFESFIP
ncbi:hypothetical protein [Clostridium saccharoperbutylacetonicum]|uniref:hypothetical protein n=1 Tax=Clostridium saccharoperbutylacetonicum TaxID=36745 RepID=UPI0030B81453